MACCNVYELCDSVYVGWKCLSRHDTSLAIYLYTHMFGIDTPIELSSRMHCFEIFPTHAKNKWVSHVLKNKAVDHNLIAAIFTLLLLVLADALLEGVSGTVFSMASLLHPTTYSTRNITSISGCDMSSVISSEPYIVKQSCIGQCERLK